MLKSQKGFTLIELVMIIVILGILAAVAVPRYVDMSTSAKSAALKGVVGQINSASAINYAGRKAGNTTDTTATNGMTCEAAAKALLEGGIPADYSVDNTKVISSGTNTCTVTQTDGGTLEASILGL